MEETKKWIVLFACVYVFINIVVNNVAASSIVTDNFNNTFFHLHRDDFPRDFLFGTSSNSYQVEGATNEGGKGQTVWDAYIQKYPYKVADKSNANIAADFYHRYKEDLNMMSNIGFKAHRFSISWSRILPGGSLASGINREGIEYYNKLINETITNGLVPYVTLFHYDYPEPLREAYGGLLSPKIVKDFRDFAEICFREFGDRVQNWITVNGPSVMALFGYTTGQFAPGRCSPWMHRDCTAGDSSTEPYIVGHHYLLCHAAAVQLYRHKFQSSQRGQIGIVLNIDWAIPISESPADIEAASRAIAFELDWFMEPLTNGSYPGLMTKNVGERLPKFTKKQSRMLRGSFDFIGLNYYTTRYAAHIDQCQTQYPSLVTDSCVRLTPERDGVPIGPKGATFWIYLYPQGIEQVLLYMKNKFNNPVVYITENGNTDANDGKISLRDTERIDCYAQHLFHVHQAFLKGANVRGYFAWTLLDDFEFLDGYTVRYGLVYVDFKNGSKRYPKDSAKWFKNFLQSRPQLPSQSL